MLVHLGVVRRRHSWAREQLGRKERNLGSTPGTGRRGWGPCSSSVFI